MADLSFDFVIVGGGCKGLSTGMYLAKYGSTSVGIFEELHELGGGLAGEQVAPGFQCNIHSMAQMTWYYDTVIKDDLPELWEEGFKQCFSVAVNAAIFPDDTCLTLYGWEQDPDGTRSAAQIARFSVKDAETYLKIRKVYLEHIRPALFEEVFSVPTPVGVPGPMMKALSNPEVVKAGLDPHIATMTALQALRILFDSQELITFLLRANLAMGFYCDDAGVALSLIAGSYETSSHASIVGGTHNLAHAMQRVLYRYGARTFTHSPVDKVIIENGIAKGIQLKDGTQVEARKAIVSTLSPHQLCYELIGPDYLSPQILRKIDALESNRICIAYFGWALTEYPKFKAQNFNPDLGSKELFSGINAISLGGKQISSILEESCYRRMYQMPPAPLILIITEPPGAQLTRDPNTFIWHTETFVPPAWAYPEEWWQKFQHEHAEWQMSQFQKYLVDMSWDKIIGFYPVTPYHTAKHFKNMAPSGNWNIIDLIPSQIGSFRPIPELAQHRTPIKNLYATGSGFGNWGSSSFCSSYSCYKVMAEDYSLRKPWEEQGRAY